MEFIGGDYLGIENIAQLFTLPFVTPPADTAYGTDIVVPMIPALLLLIPWALRIYPRTFQTFLWAIKV